MARVYTPDLQHTLIDETNFGVTPASGATRYILPVSVDQNPLVAEATSIVSDTKRLGRGGNGSQRGMVNVSGSLGMRLQRTPVIDALFEYAMSSKFATKVLKAGSTDKSFSIVSKFAADQFKVNAGCMAKGFTIDAKGNEGVTVSFDVMGAAQSISATDNAITALVDIASTAQEFVGNNVQNVTIGGTAVSFLELSFQTNLDRTQSPVLGSNVGLAFGVNGTRSTEFTAKIYRDSLAIDTQLLNNNRFAMTFDITVGTNNGYRFSCPAMDFDLPQDELNNGSAFITIKGTAATDSASGTDVIITQL